MQREGECLVAVVAAVSSCSVKVSISFALERLWAGSWGQSSRASASPAGTQREGTSVEGEVVGADDGGVMRGEEPW